jgi:threonine synthase
MLYYSTNFKAKKVTFRQALLQGLAEDKGLYMPVSIPAFTSAEITAMQDMTYPEIALTVGRKFLADEIPETDLKRLVDDAYDYEVPLEKVKGRHYLMRLDQGPTASFKDFAARLMGRLMNYYLNLEHRKLLILTATSGDTGSAIANAFYGLDNIKVVVLYPEREVTPRQRKQMSTLGKNVCLISIDGKFDDCQALVKKSFIDPDLAHLGMSSANSINIGRLIPQTMYYFYAYARLAKDGEEAVFSVPSGNFGDLMGGLIAMQMGLPVHRFVVATNENDEFPLYVKSGEYKVISPSRNCISSAMNVGHPSNVARLITLYGGVMDETGKILKQPDLEKLRRDMYAISITDNETEQTIAITYKQHNVLLEPHGAVGWAGLLHYLKDNIDEDRRLCISLETAHPAKFPEKITEILGIDPALPPSLQNLEGKEEFITPMRNDYAAFHKFLLENYGK